MIRWKPSCLMPLMVGLAGASGSAKTAAAQVLEQAALDQIAASAAAICGDFNRAGSEGSAEAKLAAEAELQGLIGRLLNLGVEGAAQIESKEYANVLQAHLSEELRDNRACRLKIWSDLINQVTAPATASEPPQPAASSLEDEPEQKMTEDEEPASATMLPGGVLFGEVLRGPFLYCVVYNAEATQITVTQVGFGYVRYDEVMAEVAEDVKKSFPNRYSWSYEAEAVACEVNCDIPPGSGSSFAGPPNDPRIADPVCSAHFQRF